MHSPRVLLSALVLSLSTPPARAQPPVFDSRSIPIEVQGWWSTEFGHIHCTTRMPVGQEVSGNLVLPIRGVLHNNPSNAYTFRVDAANIGTISKQAINFQGAYDGANESNQSFAFNHTVPTTKMPNGWQTLRLRLTVRTPDRQVFTTSSEIPVYVNNPNRGGRSDLATREVLQTINAGSISFIGKGWYTGFDYSNVQIDGVPIKPVKGLHTFRARVVKGGDRRLTVSLDKTHAIPAASPWPAVPAAVGQVLLDSLDANSSWKVIRVDTTKLTNGWHHIAAQVESGTGGFSQCSFCTRANELGGVAKVWFYVQN